MGHENIGGHESIGSNELIPYNKLLLKDLKNDILDKHKTWKKFYKKLIKDFPTIRKEKIHEIEYCFDIFGKDDFSYEIVKDILIKNTNFDFKRLGKRKLYKICYSTKDVNFSDRIADERLLIGIIKSNVDEDEYDFNNRKSLIENLSNTQITIGSYTFALMNHINIMSGIYHLGIEKGAPYCDRNEIVIQHQKNINEMISLYSNGDETNQIMFGDHLSDPETFEISFFYQEKYDNYKNISNLKPDQCISLIKERLDNEKNIGKNIIIDLYGHGSIKNNKGRTEKNSDYEKGNMEYGSIDRTKETLNKLFEIDDQRLIISIGSCNSSYKLDNKNDKSGILYFDSGKQVSNNLSTKYFLNTNYDFNEDGHISWIEKKIGEIIYYNDSKTHLYRQKDSNNRIRIS